MTAAAIILLYEQGGLRELLNDIIAQRKPHRALASSGLIHCNLLKDIQTDLEGKAFNRS